MTQTERRDRGAVIPFVAILLPVLILMTSFAVDLGRQRSSRRTMQADADVISLDMVRLADGRSSLDIYMDPATETALQASADRNEIDRAKIVEVVWGEMSVDGDFVPHHQPQFAPSDASLIASAVKITATEETDYFFQPGSGSATRSAVAEVEETEIGAFSIGSSLARLSTGDSALLNPLMTALLGSNVALGALDYQGLVAADVNLLDLMAAAAGVGTVDELLASDLSMAEFLDLSADALTNRGMLAEAELIRNLPTNIPTPENVSLGDILNLPVDEQSALLADINVIDLIIAAAQVANGDNFLNLNLGIPNLASLRMQVTEPPKIAIGPAEQDENGIWVTQAHSANLRLDLVIDPPKLALSLLGLAGAEADFRVPITLTGGGASGYLTDVDCTTEPDNLSVLTVPRPLGGSIVAVSPPLARVTALVNLLLTTIRIDVATVTANIGLPLEDPSQLPATTLTIPVGDQQSATARGLDLGGVLTVNNLTVNLLGVLPLSLGPLLAVLNPILSTVDVALDPVLELLGVRIGETDVAALDARCDRNGVKLVE